MADNRVIKFLWVGSAKKEVSQNWATKVIMKHNDESELKNNSIYKIKFKKKLHNTKILRIFAVVNEAASKCNYPPLLKDLTTRH